LHSALVLLCVALAPSSGFAGTTENASCAFLHASHAAVASDSQAASAAGVEMLKSGGNAVDAACAAALTLGVVDPFASGLGGGGFALIYLAKTDKAVAIDFRETAPAALTDRLRSDRAISPQSGLSVGVPGEPRGLAKIIERFGALPFSRCIEPALRHARGFAISPWLAQQIREELERNPNSGPDLLAKIFSIDRQAAARLQAGDRVARPALAATLERLRRNGAEAFYRGEIARAIVAAVAAAGGVLALDDLARYTPVERQPLATSFLGRRVLVMPPPSAGGTILVEALGLLEHRMSVSEAWKRDAGPASPGYLHELAEALKHGFADRARFLGDPAFTHVPLEHLLDPRYHRELATRIRPDRILTHDAYGTPTERPTKPARDAGTAHISVVDEAGNAVALTTTVNLEFGARIVVGGIVLNDQLDDFTGVNDQPDVFSLSGSNANRPAPGKRPVSSMSPTIVLGDRGIELVTGAAGGPRIVSATLQVLLDVLAFGLSPQQAVMAPRIHHQWEPDILYYEPSLPSDVVRALKNKGQNPKSRQDIGKANAIGRTQNGLDAAADPRSGGGPAGY
jgi:gamma-glutamyltranspeptidase / glutathione hydrolase